MLDAGNPGVEFLFLHLKLFLTVHFFIHMSTKHSQISIVIIFVLFHDKIDLDLILKVNNLLGLSSLVLMERLLHNDKIA